MQVMNMIGNKYEITMYEWYEILAKAEKRLQESIECNKRFGDNEDWITEDTEKVEKIKNDIEQVKQKLESMNIIVDYEKIKNMIKI
jgi:predicted SAM-dependent methyltransferase